MAQTPDMTSCLTSTEDRDEALTPYYALSYHFGMLLGVDDFSTEQAYHRGKMRLHNAWLHRAGVVWGFDVQCDLEHGEIRVKPGLALDAAGRELHLEADACVNLGEWFLAHKNDEGFVYQEIPNGFSFDAHVELRFKSCLTRQVPAMQEPCVGASTGAAYSRVFETVDLLLAPNQTPAPEAPPYHLLRVLFGLEAAALPADQAVADARAQILTLPSGEQPAAYLQALRRFAALDEIALAPAKTDDDLLLLFPGRESTPVVLADINHITIERSNESEPFKLTGGEVDVTVRPSLIATATIQELLCGPQFRNVGAPSESTGPRVLPDKVTINEAKITLELDRDVEPNSVSAESFSLTVLGANGWQDVALTPAVSGPAALTLELASNLAQGDLVRLIVRGTGPKPLLGKNLVPLAGGVGGPEPQAHDGIDFVFMQERS
jgi:hypothetical protein